MQTKESTFTRFLRIREVEQVTVLKRSTINQHVVDGNFPAPYKLGLRASGWKDDEVRRWVEGRLLSRTQTTHNYAA